MSEKYPITTELLEAWLKQAILTGVGYFKICNSGGCNALMEKGIYTVTKNGHTEMRYTERERILEIFRQLVNKYHNFERNGYAYYWYDGSWRRCKQNTVHQKP